MITKLYWVILLLLFSQISFAEQWTEIYENQPVIKLSPELFIYEDPTSKLTLTQILSPAFKQKFIRYSQFSQQRNSIGLSQSTYWLKFTLKNTSKTTNWFLQNNDNSIQYVKLYQRAYDATIKHYTSGALTPLFERPYHSHRVILPINIPTNQQRDYYLKVHSLTPVILNLSLKSESALLQSESTHNVISGTILGIMLVLLMVNLLFYAMLKFQSQLYLIGYILGSLLAYSAYDGYLLYFFPDFLLPYDSFIFLTASSLALISLYYYVELLLLKDVSITTKNVLRYTVISYWGLVIILSYATTMQLPYKMYVIGAFILPFIGVFYSGYAWLYKRHQARFIFFGLCSLTIAHFMQMSQQLGIIASVNHISVEVNQLGNIILTTLLSIAIVDYVRQFQLMQQKTLNKVKQAEDKFKRVFDQAYQMLFLIAKDGTVISANNEALRFLDQKKSTLLKQNFTNIFSSLKGIFDQNEMKQNIEKALQGELVSQNIVAYSTNGNLKNLELSFQPYVKQQTTVDNVLIQVRDITKQAQAFKAIQDMVVGIAGLSTENFFKKFLIEISQIYNAKYVVLSQLNETNPPTATTVAITQNKRQSENFTYAIKGSPSEKLINNHLCNYPKDVQQSFPEDEWLKEHDIECYLGVNIKDSNNHIIGFLSVMDDRPLEEDNYFIEVLDVFAARIGNELKQQESQEALKTALEKLDFHITHTPLGVIEWDEHFNVTKWNKAAEKIFGFTLEHFKGKNPLEVLLPKEEIPNIVEVSKELKAKKGGRYSLNKNLTLSGKEILCEWYNTPLLNSEGKLIGVASLVNDVTAEHNALNALYIKEQEQREIFNALMDAVFIIDQQGEILSTNTAAESLFDYPVEQLINQKASCLLTGKFVKGYRRYINTLFQCLPAQDVPITQELMGRKKNGELFPINLSLTSLPIDNLGRKRLLATCHDLTEFRIQQESLRQSQKMDALGNLTGGIAHDFNNLLGIINGYAELLNLKTRDDENLAKYVNHILKASARGAKLTQKLLSFSRKNTEEKELVNINHLLLDEFDMLQKTITPRINLTYSLNDELPLTNIDKAELEDCILNLAINAMHAIEESGEIIIATAIKQFSKQQANLRKIAPGKFIQLSVTDNGIGMNEQTKQKALEPFFSTKGNTGTGLGLSQVYGFVERSNGFIEIDSTLGKGTTVTINLPIAFDQVVESRVKKSSPIATIAGAVILVVDDESSLVELSKTILSDAGYQVLTANNAEQALAQLKQHQIDAILCDIIMPNMGGNELAEIIQKQYPDIAILFVSGYYQQDSTKTAKIPSEQVIKKPYNADELLRRIAQSLTDKQTFNSTRKQLASN
ncbi:hypothetical protein tinsulaeT_08120 [Thalassotalea insulae]|uniref:histidine kinase n=1 Tax=Thalassotalea insulae TaxID=2056778 RepID=A0ABQ6GNG6_9GAMM|nr:PAS domain S-box protein [Thalassotalea insulae]GLX77472.1 hypothetical protein tinsulaeT_08120 [Thalassotalea insulae]